MEESDVNDGMDDFADRQHPGLLAAGWVVFQQWDEFFECVGFWFTPDIISLFNGEYIDEKWAKLRLLLWVVLCGLSIFGEYSLLTKYLIHN